MSGNKFDNTHARVIAEFLTTEKGQNLAVVELQNNRFSLSGMESIGSALMEISQSCINLLWLNLSNNVVIQKTDKFEEVENHHAGLAVALPLEPFNGRPCTLEALFWYKRPQWVKFKNKQLAPAIPTQTRRILMSTHSIAFLQARMQRENSTVMAG